MQARKDKCPIVFILILLMALLSTGLSLPAVAQGDKEPITAGNKKALILAPMSKEAGHAFDPDLEESLRKAGYEVTKITGDDVKLEHFRQLDQYSVVFIFAHGMAGNDMTGDWSYFATGIPYSLGMYYSNIKDFELGRLSVHVKSWTVCVCNSYIEAYNKNFPDGLFYANSCHIMENNALWDSLKDKGIKALVGFSRTWQTQDANKGESWSTDDNLTIEFFKRATEPNYSVDRAYEEVKGGEENWNLERSYDPNVNAFYLNYQEAGKLPEMPDVGDTQQGKVPPLPENMDENDMQWNVEVKPSSIRKGESCEIDAEFMHITPYPNDELWFLVESPDGNVYGKKLAEYPSDVFYTGDYERSHHAVFPDDFLGASTDEGGTYRVFCAEVTPEGGTYTYDKEPCYIPGKATFIVR